MGKVWVHTIASMLVREKVVCSIDKEKVINYRLNGQNKIKNNNPCVKSLLRVDTRASMITPIAQGFALSTKILETRASARNCDLIT